MSAGTFFSWFVMLILLLTACSAPIAAGQTDNEIDTPETETQIVAAQLDPVIATPSPLPQYPPNSCPVTQPQDPIFIPPAPYSPQAPYNQFWYGTNELWTAIEPDGRWYALPHDEDGYTQKVFWWREGYDMTEEQRPQITMSGRRLDGDAPAFEQTGGTNGHHDDLGQFMLTGVEVPTAGCWELTGRYGEAELSFVVWVAP